MLWSGRFSRDFALCMYLVLTSTASLAQRSAEAVAPTPAALPAWAVLVLKPIGADRVRPVTGVVVSEQGLVIVPLAFAAPGDQIIVLDGGTDIIANGRAATIRQQIPDAGLTVLSAPGLKRQPASLAAARLADGEEIRLAAFPPAELIAQGAAPVSAMTQVAVANAAAQTGGEALTMTPTAAVKALPNVTGPLLDSCGNLVGFSSADGVQSMDTTMAPAYLWKDGLLRALQSLPLELKERPCPATDISAVEELPLPAQSAKGTQLEEISAQAAADTDEPNVAAGSDGLAVTDEPSSATMRARWIPWLGLLLIVLLAGLVWLFFRRRANLTNREKSPPSGDMTTWEPETALSPAASPESEQGTEQTDCVLEISGRLPNGTPFVSSCNVNGAAINVVIGRGGADIAIDSQDVHREHVRLSGSGDMLTISDLGSSRGTWINRVPCLRGEIMFIGVEDTIFLGDVSFQVCVRPRQLGETDARGS